MKILNIILVLALVPCLFAAVSVKYSAPFVFPSGPVGLAAGRLAAHGPAFTCTGGLASRPVTFAWKLPLLQKNASIAVYNIQGKLLHRLPVTTAQGRARWDCRRNGLAHGLYIARLQTGAIKHTLKFVVLE